MKDRADEKNDAGLAMDAKGNFDPSHSGAELEDQKNEVENSEKQNNRNTRNGHGLSPLPDHSFTLTIAVLSPLLPWRLQFAFA